MNTPKLITGLFSCDGFGRIQTAANAQGKISESFPDGRRHIFVFTKAQIAPVAFVKSMDTKWYQPVRAQSSIKPKRRLDILNMLKKGKFHDSLGRFIAREPDGAKWRHTLRRKSGEPWAKRVRFGSQEGKNIFMGYEDAFETKE